MDMKGEYRIAASREAVWEALNDPEVLKAAIPGCQELIKTSETGFEATVQAKVGPVKAKFSGAVTLSDIDPPNGYTISGEGKGGAAGFAKGGAKVALAEDNGETILTYEVDANVGGKLAQIGSRLIDSTAKKMAGEFFSAFAAEVETRAGAPATDSHSDEPVEAEKEATEAGLSDESIRKEAAKAAAAAADDVKKARGSLNPFIWTAAVIIIAGILIYGFSGQ